MRNVHGEFVELSTETLWDAIALFGIVVDNDAPFTDLYGYYHPTDDYYDGSYYVPDEHDTEVSLVDIFNPPVVDTAWDARPVAA